MMTIMTVGHSVLSESDFTKLLLDNEVTILCDIRSHPVSRWPQHWGTEMTKYLAAAGIQYKFERYLGGWVARHRAWTSFMAEYGVDLSCYFKGFFPKNRIARSVPMGTRLDIRCPLHGCPVVPVEGKAHCSCDRKAKDTVPRWTSVGLRDMSFCLGLPEAIEAVYELIALGKSENIAIMCCEAQWWRCHRSLVADMLVHFGSDAIHIPGRKAHSAVIGDRLERYEPAILEAWRTGGFRLDNQIIAH